VDFIIGFPEETSVHRRETLLSMKELHRKFRARIHLHYFIPLSGTTLADSMPRELDYRSLDVINAYEKGGICTGWWRDGKKLSQEVVRMREQLRETDIFYQEVDWRVIPSGNDAAKRSLREDPGFRDEINRWIPNKDIWE
jgi:radical SAM superfamily enzyme YgiQ (UPF0313 family)